MRLEAMDTQTDNLTRALEELDRKDREDFARQWKAIAANWVTEHRAALDAMRDKGTADG